MLEIIGPRQVVAVISRAAVRVMGRKSLRQNLTRTAWHTPVSIRPPLYYISLEKDSFTLELISKSRVFSVNFLAKRHSRIFLWIMLQAAGTGTRWQTLAY